MRSGLHDERGRCGCHVGACKLFPRAQQHSMGMRSKELSDEALEKFLNLSRTPLGPWLSPDLVPRVAAMRASAGSATSWTDAERDRTPIGVLVRGKACPGAKGAPEGRSIQDPEVKEWEAGSVAKKPTFAPGGFRPTKKPPPLRPDLVSLAYPRPAGGSTGGYPMSAGGLPIKPLPPKASGLLKPPPTQPR